MRSRTWSPDVRSTTEAFTDPPGDASPGALGALLGRSRVGYDELRGRRGRRRTDIGDEIGEGDVRFMADPRAHRPRETRQCADERFIVERPELLGRTTPAREYHHIEIADLGEAVERVDDRLDRADALHLCRREDELDARVAARDDGLDVAPDRADRACDHADPARGERKPALALRSEEAFGRETPLERL